MGYVLLGSWVLHMLFAVGSAVCFFWVSLQTFRHEGLLRGFVGTLCLWGVVDAERYGVEHVTRVWSGLVVAAFANLTLWLVLRSFG